MKRDIKSERLGLRRYVEYFHDSTTKGKSPEYHMRTRCAVESFLSAMPRSKIGNISKATLDAWEEAERANGVGGAQISEHRGRLIVMWMFAYEHGDNHNPPPSRYGRGGYDWGEQPKVEFSSTDDPAPPYCCEAGRAFVAINGLQHDLGEADSEASHVAYTRLIAEYDASGRAPHFGHPIDSITIAQLLNYHECFARRYYGDGNRTEADSMRYAAKYLAMYHDLPAHQFGPLQLQAVRMRVYSSRCTRNYCNMVTARIKRIFRWAASQQLISAEVSHAIASVAGWRRGRSPARESRPVVPVPREHVEATLPHLLPTVRAMVQIQLLTGARPGEIFKMRPCDIDRAGDIWIYEPSSHKTQIHGKSRSIPLGPRAQEILTPYLLRPADSYCFSPKQSLAEAKDNRRRNRGQRKTPLYPSETRRVERAKAESRLRQSVRAPGDCYLAGSYRTAISRACLAAGVPRWFPYQLRHAAATEFRKEFGVEAAQVLLGHSNLSVTEMYAEKNGALGIRVAKAVG